MINAHYWYLSTCDECVLEFIIRQSGSEFFWGWGSICIGWISMWWSRRVTEITKLRCTSHKNVCKLLWCTLGSELRDVNANLANPVIVRIESEAQCCAESRFCWKPRRTMMVPIRAHARAKRQSQCVNLLLEEIRGHVRCLLSGNCRCSWTFGNKSKHQCLSAAGRRRKPESLLLLNSMSG
jgi:hypothetical protein